MHFFGEGLPPGLVLNPSTGAITGTPALGDAAYSTYSVTVFASDGGAFTQETFTWSITDPVAFTAVAANQSSTEGATPTATFGASDASSGTVKYAAVGLPPGLSMNTATGAITGSVALGAAAAGSYSVTVTANDGTYSASETFTWAVANPITLTAPSGESSTEGGSVSVSPSARDAGSGTVTYTALGLPPGLSVNSVTGAITGTPAVGSSGFGTYSYTLVASDGMYSTAQTGTWMVANPITNQSVPAVSFNAAQAISFQVTTRYAGSGTLTYSATGLPPGLTINAATGMISGTLDIGAAMRGTSVVTVWVTDGTYTASNTINISVSGDPEVSMETQQQPGNSLEDKHTITLLRKMILDTETYKALLESNPGLTDSEFHRYLRIRDQVTIQTFTSEGLKARFVFQGRIKEEPDAVKAYTLLENGYEKAREDGMNKLKKLDPMNANPQEEVKLLMKVLATEQAGLVLRQPLPDSFPSTLDAARTYPAEPRQEVDLTRLNPADLAGNDKTRYDNALKAAEKYVKLHAQLDGTSIDFVPIKPVSVTLKKEKVESKVEVYTFLVPQRGLVVRVTADLVGTGEVDNVLVHHGKITNKGDGKFTLKFEW